MSKSRFVVNIFILFCSGKSIAIDNFYVKPYLGINLNYSIIKFEKGYGDNLFPRQHYNLNPFIGSCLHDNFAIEAGFETSFLSSRTAALKAGDINLGQEENIGVARAVYESKIKTKSFYVTSLFLLSLKDAFSNSIFFNKMEIYGGVGGTLFNPYLTRTLQSINGVRLANPSTINLGKSKTELLLRLNGGAIYSLNDDFKLRFNINWENTSKITATEVIGNNVIVKAKFKDRIQYGLGLQYQL